MGIFSNDVPSEYKKGLRGANKANKWQRQVFQRVTEPSYTPLIQALMQRAGLSPYTALGKAPQPQGMAQGAPAPGVGQAVPGVQQGAAPPGQAAQSIGAALQIQGKKKGRKGRMQQAPGPTAIPQNPPPLSLPQPGGQASVLPQPGQVGYGPGWQDADRVKFQTGLDNINSQYGVLNNQAQANMGRRGLEGSSIAAGLQARLARDQGQQINNLGRDVAMGGIEEERRRYMDLLNALMPSMGFPAQAAQGGIGQAQAALQGQDPSFMSQILPLLPFINF